MSENQLAVIVEESGLDAPKAQVMLENFQDYFEIAAEWEKKAKAIVVTDATQTGDMKMAREGRLYLKEKRIAIENIRKKLKEQSLREGKAIDGIANVLKALIVPLEQHLDQQEHFVEIRAKAKADEIVAQERLEAERKQEEERVAKEKAEREERERIQAENEKLKQEALEKEKELAEERAQQRDAEAAARAEREQMAEVQRQKDETARQEREAREAKLAAALNAQEDAEALLKAQVECPKCHHKFVPEGSNS